MEIASSMRRILLILFGFLPVLAIAQGGYQLDFQIKDLKDTTVLLGYYYGESTFKLDTARSDKNGKFRFAKPKRLERGMYFLIVNGKVKLFEPGFLVTDDQEFLLTSSGPDYVRNMKVTGDLDNQLFFESMVFNGDRHKEAEPLVKILKDSTLKEEQKKEAREAYLKIDQRVQAYQDELIRKHPTLVTSKMLNMNRRVEVPEPPRRADGSIDSAFQFRYYRKHFFDNFDITDDALIRLPTPIYQQKLEEYLDKLFFQTPDSLMKAINELVARVKSNKETYKYVVYNCIYKYNRPTIMGLDEVYVRVYDTYFATGEMDYWASATMKKNLKDYANKIRNSLVGKTGANLVMQDQNFQKRAMYDIRKKYTIVFIFDPDCGHCKEESPKLVNFYNNRKEKYNIEVFAVSLDTSMQKMRNYIRDMKFNWITVNGPRSYSGPIFDFYYADTTPMVYILDEKHKIIAKGLPVSQLEEFLSNHEKFEARRAAGPKPKGTGPGNP